MLIHSVIVFAISSMKPKRNKSRMEVVILDDLVEYVKQEVKNKQKKERKKEERKKGKNNQNKIQYPSLSIFG